MKLNKFLGTALMTATLATGSAFMPSEAVSAATTQQLEIKTGGYTRVTVSGKNQKGQTVTWGPYTSNGTVKTNNWWWQSGVKVTVDKRNPWYVLIGKSPSRTCTFYVQQDHIFDYWDTVTCD